MLEPRGVANRLLIVDEAQDLHPRTLTGLKRLMEVVAGGGGLLSMLLAAHPKLRIDLHRPDMEQVGANPPGFARLPHLGV